jgi:uncharacterized membrane-anchored protein
MGAKLKQMLNKVPEVVVSFWIIKVLCTTIGETAADYLNETLHFGLKGTSLVMGALLALVLVIQFRAKKYVPTIYWLAVVLISIAGTLITDNLTDGMGVPLPVTTAVFGVMLLATFAAWYLSERTLSVHSITTTRREAFYWLTILFTFALGTAAGDLVAEKWNLGYLNSLLLFAGLIALIAGVHFGLKALRGQLRRPTDAVLAFWLVYVLTRPLGASIGDYLSQAKHDGGLGLGTTTTSAIFLAAIAVLVTYLTVSRRDALHAKATRRTVDSVAPAHLEPATSEAADASEA